MSLPSLVALPKSLLPLVSRAKELFLSAARDVSPQAADDFAAWPAERCAAFERVCAASDFVTEQVSRDPQMLLQLAEAGLLERPLRTGKKPTALNAVPAECAEEGRIDTLFRSIRNREQVRISWRDLVRQSDLAETCADLSNLADSRTDVAYRWLYARHCEQ